MKAQTFSVTTFTAREGFDVDKEGNLIVDPDPGKISYFWYGRNGRDHLFLTVHRGHPYGMLYGPGQRLALGSEGREVILRELDAAAVDAGGCATAEVARLAASDRSAASKALWSAIRPTAGPSDATAKSAIAKPKPSIPTAPAKHGARIGIMIYYTNQALALFGNDLAQLQGRATGLIDELNQSMVNSDDVYYVQFAQVGGLFVLPGYAESPGITDPPVRFSTHIATLRDYELLQSDPRRATVGADFAILLVADTGSPADPIWGGAYGQRHNCIGDDICDVGDGVFPIPNFGYRNYAYAAVSVHPTAQNLTFAHEVGHMLGNDHDVNAQSPADRLRPAYAFSLGYRLPTIARDIMADPRCIDDDGPAGPLPEVCTDRQPQFANPRQTFFGQTAASGTANTDVVRTISCLAEPSGNLFPFTDQQRAPDIFWGGFEAGAFRVTPGNPRCPAPLRY